LLDHTCKEYLKKVWVDEEKLADLLAHLLWNKKIICQAEEKAQRKAKCLASKLD